MTSSPRLAKILRPLLPALLALAVLPGCESETYSDAVQYRVRTDPIVKQGEAWPGSEFIQPDRPGQFPLLAAGQLEKIADLLPDGSTQSMTSKLRDPMQVSDQDRQVFQETLDGIFGKPAQPRLNLKGTDSLKKLLGRGKDRLEKTLARGSRVYRIQCQMCHGVTGDGRGPTAPWVNPHPRDYRQGFFKFQSVDQTDGPKRKPLVADLERTIHNGIEGTAMPAFNLLPKEDIEAMARYVILLSLRGEAEMRTFQDLNEKGGQLTARGLKGGIRGDLRFWVGKLAGEWVASQDKAIGAVPYRIKADDDEALKQSVLRGKAIFLADEPALKKLFPGATKDEMKALNGASCTSCHVDYGRQAKFKFDDWGTLVRPANLTAGVYRGGRRPIDLYWRIHSGINGSNMNHFGDVLTLKGSDVVTNERIWDLVNFVRALPYPAMRKGYGFAIH